MKEVFYSVILRQKLGILFRSNSAEYADCGQASYARLERTFCNTIGTFKSQKKRNKTTFWTRWTEISDQMPFHPEEKYVLDKLFWNYDQQGEKEFIEWYKNNRKILKQKYDKGHLSLDDAYLSHKINNH